MKLWEEVKKWWPTDVENDSGPNHLQRYQRLQERMVLAGLEHHLMESARDIFYFTGMVVSSGSLVAHCASPADLVVDGRYFGAIAEGFWELHLLEKKFWPSFFEKKEISSIGFDPLNSSYARWSELKDLTGHLDVTFVPEKNLTRSLQRVKDVFEIEKMTDAGELAVEALACAKEHLVEGVTEKEVARRVRLFFVEKHAQTSFEPIIAFGDHSANPHHICSDRRLKKGDIVLIDLGAKRDHYCSDLTRTFFFDHIGSQELHRLWKLTYDAFIQAKELVRSSISCKELDQKVRFCFQKQDVEELFLHSLGHGIGLDLHEAPSIRSDHLELETLETGSTITIEPGLYRVGLGGIRLEDTLVVHPEGAPALTPSPFDIVYRPKRSSHV